MARLRKTGRLWRPAMREAAAPIMAACEGCCFAVEPDTLFDRPAPLEIELGAGRGDFLIARAGAMPQRNFLAVELAAAVAQLMAVRAARTGVPNLRIIRMDARPLVNLFLSESSVAAYHVYFPDPWPKARHSKHRLFTNVFGANLARTLEPGGFLYAATDVAAYGELIFAIAASQGLRPIDASVPGVTETAFARRFTAAGKRIYSQAFVKEA